MGEELNSTPVTTTDNSLNTEADINSAISDVLDGPVGVQETNTEDGNDNTTKTTDETENKDNTQTIECPDKFKDKDGNVNVENLLKSYSALEQKQSQDNANWQKERAELLKSKEQLDKLNEIKEQAARQAGYSSALEMQQTNEVADFQAKEYSKYLQYVDPEDRENLARAINFYAKNPSKELLQEIALEFAPEINMDIAVRADRMKQQFEQQKVQQENTRVMANIEDVISKSVDSNQELFGYKPFKDLFVNTLQKYGKDFTVDDAKALMNTVVELKELFRQEFAKENGAKVQNNKATDKLANITGTNSAPNKDQQIEKSFDDMSEAELMKTINSLI